ncbi:MAG: hypothetical protein ACF8R7_03890 [Phycisphaerales bacterium JB039]
MQLILTIAAIYLVIGLIFAAGFVTIGVGRLDSAARAAPALFRVIILPGAAALWPVLMLRLVRGGRSGD